MIGRPYRPRTCDTLVKRYKVVSEELLAAYRQFRSEEDILNGQLKRLEEFSGEPSPPDKATFDKLADY
ncbi:hypothetical protein ACFLWO_02980 [Chloroflexota bacterium]